MTVQGVWFSLLAVIVFGTVTNSSRTQETLKERVSLKGHDGYVQSVAFSPNGKTIASGSADGTVRLWEVATGKELASLDGGGVVLSVAFSPDGRLLASSGGPRNLETLSPTSGQVRLWDVATRRQLHVLGGHSGMVDRIAFSPDGNSLAAGGAGGAGDSRAFFKEPTPGEVRLWSVADGKQVEGFTPYAGTIKSISFSPDGRTMAIGCGNPLMVDGSGREIVLLDAKTGKPSGKLIGHERGVAAVAFSPDGKSLASGSYIPFTCGEIRLWDVATQMEKIRIKVDGYGPIHYVAFSPDGQTLVTSATHLKPSGIALWDPKTGKQKATVKLGSSIATLVYSPDGRMLAGGGGDWTVRLWDVLREK